MRETKRDRFYDNMQIYTKELMIDNIGKHSPNKFYDTIHASKIATTYRIKRAQQPSYRFATEIRKVSDLKFHQTIGPGPCPESSR
mgnify:CR=1 FL=1